MAREEGDFVKRSNPCSSGPDKADSDVHPRTGWSWRLSLRRETSFQPEAFCVASTKARRLQTTHPTPMWLRLRAQSEGKTSSPRCSSREEGVNLEEVEGTGDHGRITEMIERLLRVRRIR